jgi:hypothetical protein
MTMIERMAELERRMGELESRIAHVPKPIPVVTPLAQHAPTPDYGSTGPKPTPWFVAEQEVLLAALAWHKLDTSVNADALHHCCEQALLARARVATGKP